MMASGFSNESVDGSANPILERVTFSNNFGGGFYNYVVGLGAVANPSLTNVTFFGNIANYGGALFNMTNVGGVAEPILSNVTLYGNRAYLAGGAIYSEVEPGGGSSNPKLYNAILWDNSVFDGGSGPVVFTKNGGTASFAYSIVQEGCPTGTDCSHMPPVSDPLLGPLADNGGSTKTLMPSVGSPAVDGGDDAMCALTDQRGVARPQGAHCDLGAVERKALEDIIFRDSFEF